VFALAPFVVGVAAGLAVVLWLLAGVGTVVVCVLLLVAALSVFDELFAPEELGALDEELLVRSWAVSLVFCTAELPMSLVLSTAWSTLGWRQNNSHITSQTSAIITKSDTINHIMRPRTDTLFCSYIQICLFYYTQYIKNITNVQYLCCLVKYIALLKT
jgi:hypothetical protein